MKAFERCKKLKDVTFQSPSQLKSIGQQAYFYCLALEEIKIPRTVTEISGGSFGMIQNLKNVDLCSGSPILHQRAFHHCNKLDYGSIITYVKMNIDTCRIFAKADLSRRVESMAHEA